MAFDPLYAFVFLGLVTPGPNVILLTASGARFGFRRTFPHIVGIALGVGIIAGLTGFGIGAIIAARPGLEMALKFAACAWILWMAWKLYESSGAPAAEGKDRPFTLVEAVLFQWVNPKIWAVALAASSGYGAGLEPLGEAGRMAIAFSGINFLVCNSWTFAGSLLAYLLSTPAHWKAFMRIMAVLLAMSAATVFL
jgi:threonine/homoserine/homoserine lactone efflux protein